ncbi:MAG: hypothetical protein KDK53_20040 [Maritimibacter sp.]|nr:hypothetical protein [Maritimibacter sp.]
MRADLKEKTSGVDRKRVYTAAVALLVAGAAGHFMQQTSGGSRNPEVMSASVPSVAAPEILPAPKDPATAPTGEAVAAATLETPEAPAREIVEQAAPEIVVAAPIASIRPAPRPSRLDEPVTVTAAVDPAPMPEAAPEAGPRVEEVTRAASDPLLTITEPAPERADESVFASATDTVEMPSPETIAPATPEMAGCDVDVTGTARPGAILQIDVTAPCNSGEQVAFNHAGLKFSEQLGPDGSLTVEVPAMTGTARVSLGFPDGSDRNIEVTVPDIEAFDRIAVIWQGATGLQLHAFEGGADYDDKGHLWADTPGAREAAVAGTGGFMTMLGSTANGFAADVYTYPAALSEAGSEPEVSIEAQVMENTCGSKIEGWILRSGTGKEPLVEPLTMTVPGCDAVGEFLVLKNLPVALKIARK